MKKEGWYLQVSIVYGEQGEVRERKEKLIARKRIRLTRQLT